MKDRGEVNQAVNYTTTVSPAAQLPCSLPLHHGVESTYRCWQSRNRKP